MGGDRKKKKAKKSKAHKQPRNAPGSPAKPGSQTHAPTPTQTSQATQHQIAAATDFLATHGYGDLLVRLAQAQQAAENPSKHDHESKQPPDDSRKRRQNRAETRADPSPSSTGRHSKKGEKINLKKFIVKATANLSLSINTRTERRHPPQKSTPPSSSSSSASSSSSRSRSSSSDSSSTDGQEQKPTIKPTRCRQRKDNNASPSSPQDTIDKTPGKTPVTSPSHLSCPLLPLTHCSSSHSHCRHKHLKRTLNSLTGSPGKGEQKATPTDGKPPALDPCTLCGQLGHDEDNCEFCFKCKTAGHTAPACPPCAYCSQQGHTATQCHTRAEDLEKYKRDRHTSAATPTLQPAAPTAELPRGTPTPTPITAPLSYESGLKLYARSATGSPVTLEQFTQIRQLIDRALTRHLDETKTSIKTCSQYLPGAAHYEVQDQSAHQTLAAAVTSAGYMLQPDPELDRIPRGFIMTSMIPNRFPVARSTIEELRRLIHVDLTERGFTGSCQLVRVADTRNATGRILTLRFDEVGLDCFHYKMGNYVNLLSAGKAEFRVLPQRVQTAQGSGMQNTPARTTTGTAATPPQPAPLTQPPPQSQHQPQPQQLPQEQAPALTSAPEKAPTTAPANPTATGTTDQTGGYTPHQYWQGHAPSMQPHFFEQPPSQIQIQQQQAYMRLQQQQQLGLLLPPLQPTMPMFPPQTPAYGAPPHYPLMPAQLQQQLWHQHYQTALPVQPTATPGAPSSANPMPPYLGPPQPSAPPTQAPPPTVSTTANTQLVENVPPSGHRKMPPTIQDWAAESDPDKHDQSTVAGSPRKDQLEPAAKGDKTASPPATPSATPTEGAKRDTPQANAARPTRPEEGSPTPKAGPSPTLAKPDLSTHDRSHDDPTQDGDDQWNGNKSTSSSTNQEVQEIVGSDDEKEETAD